MVLNVDSNRGRPRFESTFNTIKTLRDDVSVIPGAQISVEKEEMGPPVGPDIELIVTGPNFIDVGNYVQKVKRASPFVRNCLHR